MAGPFQPLNQNISVPGIDYGGADGSVLFDTLSTSKTSPAVGISFSPVVIKAYNLREGESIAVNNLYSQTGATSPYTRAGTAVVLTPDNTTEVLFLTGYYQLVFTGTLGQLVVTSTTLDKVRLVGPDGITAAMLRSDVAFPNPLFVDPDVGLLSTKVMVGPMPWVFRAFGLTGDQSISVLNVYSKNGVDTVEPLSVAGVDATLTATNNTLILDLAGTYQFQIGEAIDGLLLIGHETSATSIDPYTLQETQIAAATAVAAAATATTEAGIATTAATSATASAALASASASSATASAATATTEAGVATTQAGIATAAATTATNEATIATTQAGIATTQATNAAASATAAAGSATTATTEAGIATTQATNAAASATAAANSATAAGTSATNAAASASTASTAATTATTQAGNASTSASAAASSASGAASSASGAAASATTATNQAAIATAAANQPRSHSSLAISSSAGVVTINLATITEDYYLTLTENVTSWVFQNPPAANFDTKIYVILQQGGSAFTCVSPATSGHTAGGAWTVSATPGAVQWLDLVINSAGTVKLLPEAVLA
jgi:hypothetical protein